MMTDTTTEALLDGNEDVNSSSSNNNSSSNSSSVDLSSDLASSSPLFPSGLADFFRTFFDRDVQVLNGRDPFALRDSNKFRNVQKALTQHIDCQ